MTCLDFERQARYEIIKHQGQTGEHQVEYRQCKQLVSPRGHIIITAMSGRSLQDLPEHILQDVFLCLSLVDLNACCLVSPPLYSLGL